LLEANGVTPVPISLDDSGPRPDELAAAIDSGIRAVVLQPRAQNPTGVTITPQRGDEVARVLDDTDTLVIEDDSIGAVAATEMHSLGRLDARRTLHIRSYSKSHGPDLRLAAIGGPAALVDPIVA